MPLPGRAYYACQRARPASFCRHLWGFLGWESWYSGGWRIWPCRPPAFLFNLSAISTSFGNGFCAILLFWSLCFNPAGRRVSFTGLPSFVPLSPFFVNHHFIFLFYRPPSFFATTPLPVLCGDRLEAMCRGVLPTLFLATRLIESPMYRSVGCLCHGEVSMVHIVISFRVFSVLILIFVPFSASCLSILALCTWVSGWLCSDWCVLEQYCVRG